MVLLYLILYAYVCIYFPYNATHSVLWCFVQKKKRGQAAALPPFDLLSCPIPPYNSETVCEVWWIGPFVGPLWPALPPLLSLTKHNRLASASFVFKRKLADHGVVLKITKIKLSGRMPYESFMWSGDLSTWWAPPCQIRGPTRPNVFGKTPCTWRGWSFASWPSQRAW